MQIITWHLKTFTWESAAFMKQQKTCSNLPSPWTQHDLSVHSCLSLQLLLCLFSQFLLVQTIWHKKAEKDCGDREDKTYLRCSKVIEVNMGFCLEASHTHRNLNMLQKKCNRSRNTYLCAPNMLFWQKIIRISKSYSVIWLFRLPSDIKDKKVNKRWSCWWQGKWFL